MTGPSPPPEAPSWPFQTFLVLTAVVSGAIVMMVEVLGSRVIGPFYGVSLFVWTALIAVTLVALAAGYAFGGIVADRRDSPDVLYAVILAAGLLVAAVPVARAPVLKGLAGLGLRSGALLSSAVLFGPSLFCLGCVSPYLVRIAAREQRHLGRTVGLLYALSTAGSFAGTVLAGFVLIARYGVDRILFALGAVLVLLALAWFLLFRRRGAALLAALPLLLALPRPEAAVSKILPNGVKVSRVLNRDTFYGNLKVVDYDYGAFRTRELLIDGQIQGGIDLADGRSIYAYAYFLEHLPVALRPGGRSCLVIGLGAGLVPRWYEAHGVRTDVVDINPAVAELAARYFGFRTSGRVHVSDARSFLREGAGRYDYVILDVFNGDTTPAHLLSLEAVRLLRERMAPEGVLAMNMIGSVRGEGLAMTASVVRTLREVFPVVEIYPAFDPGRAEGYGNLTVVARSSAAPLDPDRLPREEVHPMARGAVARNLGATLTLPSDTPGMVLTDDYNPLDVAEVPLKERDRRAILQYTDWDILL